MSIFQMFWFTDGSWSRSSQKSITITRQCSKEDNPIINMLIILLISKHQVQVHKTLYYLLYMVYGTLIYLILPNSQKTLLNVIVLVIICVLIIEENFKEMLVYNGCYMAIFNRKLVKVGMPEAQMLFQDIKLCSDSIYFLYLFLFIFISMQ